MKRLHPPTVSRSLAGIALLFLATACPSHEPGPDPPLPPDTRDPVTPGDVPPDDVPPDDVPPGDVTPGDVTPEAGIPGRALLVGVGRFKSKKVRPLDGPANDVPMVEALLRDRFGFDPAKMTVLLNEAATRQRVIEELKGHIAKLGPDELFVFYLSGHGSQSADRGTDEEDGKDETFIMYDSRTPSEWDLSDDDLGYHLAKLKKTQAVVILDTCHSGSGTRGVLVQRAVEEEAPDDPNLQTRGERNPDGTGTFNVRGIEATHVLLTAAAANQVAVETKVDGIQRGVFTTALVRALSKGDPNKSMYDFVHEDLQFEVTALRNSLNIKGLANPQLEVPQAMIDLPLFALERSQARLAWTAAHAAGNGRARVEGGALVGGRLGSVWALYPTNEVDFAPASALARGRCVEVTANGRDTVLELEGDAPDLAAGARAVLVAGAPPGPIGLQLADDDVAAALAADLTAALGTAGVITPDLEPGGWRIQAGASGGFDLVLADESPWASVEAATAAQDVAALTRHCAVVDAFEALEHPASALDLKFELARTLDPPGTVTRGASIALEAGFPRYGLANMGGEPDLENSLLLDLRVDRECWVLLVFVGDDGSPFTFFPNENQSPEFLPGGRLQRGWARIPDTLSGGRAGIHLGISEPAGIQAIAALVVDDAAVAEALHTRLSAATDPGALIAELGRVREDLLFGSLAQVDWDAATVTYVVDDDR